MSLSFNLKRKNSTENESTPQNYITLKNQQNYVNNNIDTTEINDLPDKEAKLLGKNSLHPNQRLD